MQKFKKGQLVMYADAYEVIVVHYFHSLCLVRHTHRKDAWYCNGNVLSKLEIDNDTV